MTNGRLGWEDWGRKKTDRPKAKANPATRMDSGAKESGSSRARLKGPRV
jgi:hypothetical protein